MIPGALPLHLQHSNDLSGSGRDRPSLHEVFKTVGSAWSSRPDIQRRTRTVARVNKPVSRKNGGARWRNATMENQVLSESMSLKPARCSAEAGC
jgi:hypothetical protein